MPQRDYHEVECRICHKKFEPVQTISGVTTETTCGAYCALQDIAKKDGWKPRLQMVAERAVESGAEKSEKEALKTLKYGPIRTIGDTLSETRGARRVKFVECGHEGSVGKAAKRGRCRVCMKAEAGKIGVEGKKPKRQAVAPETVWLQREDGKEPARAYALLREDEENWLVRPIDNANCPPITMPKEAWKRAEKPRRQPVPPEPVMSKSVERRLAIQRQPVSSAPTEEVLESSPTEQEIEDMRQLLRVNDDLMRAVAAHLKERKLRPGMPGYWAVVKKFIDETNIATDDLPESLVPPEPTEQEFKEFVRRGQAAQAAVDKIVEHPKRQEKRLAKKRREKTVRKTKKKPVKPARKKPAKKARRK